MHAQRYGTSAPDERAEIVSLRSTVTGCMRKPPQRKISRGRKAPPAAAFGGKRKVYFDGTRFIQRRPFGARRCLPATRSWVRLLIEEYASTTVLVPGDGLEVDAYGNLAIRLGG